MLLNQNFKCAPEKYYKHKKMHFFKELEGILKTFSKHFKSTFIRQPERKKKIKCSSHRKVKILECFYFDKNNIYLNLTNFYNSLKT